MNATEALRNGTQRLEGQNGIEVDGEPPKFAEVWEVVDKTHIDTAPFISYLINLNENLARA